MLQISELYVVGVCQGHGFFTLFLQPFFTFLPFSPCPDKPFKCSITHCQANTTFLVFWHWVTRGWAVENWLVHCHGSSFHISFSPVVSHDCFHNCTFNSSYSTHSNIHWTSRTIFISLSRHMGSCTIDYSHSGH